MLSWLPIPSSFLKTWRSCPTFCLVICFSGLKRCASYVRLYISQSSGLGFASISFVTGVKLLLPPGACATCATDEDESASSAMDDTRKKVRIIVSSLKIRDLARRAGKLED